MNQCATVVGTEADGDWLRRLCRAILCDAVSVLEMQKRRPTGRNAREAREVVEWIWRDDEAWAFSFRNVCAICGEHPSRVRTALRARGLLR